MKEKLSILSAHIKDDLQHIERIEEDLRSYMKSIGDKTPDDFQKPVIGYFLHNFYNACENIFLNIAKTFENNIEPHEWHKSILKG